MPSHRHGGRATDEIPDYLSISFSTVDAVNHFFVPSSLEKEDVVVQLDRTLAEMLTFIDKTVGLKYTLKIRFSISTITFLAKSCRFTYKIHSRALLR